MATVNSSTTNNIYQSLSSKNKGLGGLATGLDTDSLLEALTTGTRSKIAKQYQQKQQLQWQVTAYRGVSGTLKAFQSKYFDYANTSATSMLSPNYFRAFKGNSSSDKIHFNSSTTTTTGSVTVDEVIQTAKARTITSKPHTKDLVGSKDLNAASLPPGTFEGKTMTLEIDGTSYRLRLDDLDGATNNADLVSRLQTIIDSTIGTKTGGKIVEAQLDGNKLKLFSDASEITVTSAPEEFGFSSYQSNRISTSDSIGEYFGLNGEEFAFQINGVEFKAQADESIQTVMNRINSDAGANCRVTFDKVTQTFIFAATRTGAGETLDMEDLQGDLLNKWIGAKSGSSYSTTGADLSMGLNDAIYGADLGTDEDLIRMFFDTVTGSFELEDKTFTFKLTVDGVEKEVEITFPDDLSSWIPKDGDGDPVDIADLLANDPTNAYLSTCAASIRSTFNSLLGKAVSEAFKDEDVSLSGISMGIDSSNQVAINTLTENQEVSLSAWTASGSEDLFALLGFSATTSSNYYDAAAQSIISDSYPGLVSGDLTIKIGDHPAYTLSGYDPDTLSFYELVNDINDYFRPLLGEDVARIENGQLILDANRREFQFSDSNGGNFFQKVFGVSSYSSGSVDSSKYDEVPGQNAEIRVAGKVVPSSINEFLINGIGFTVTEAMSGPVTIDVASDTDALLDRITSFIEEYNALIDTLNGVVTEKPVSGYDPLTDEQKAEMSEKEIEKWETEAKKGLLYMDPTVRRIVTQLREAFYEKVESAGLSVYNIGITTMGLSSSSGSMDYSNSGKLDVDADALRAAIERNPEAIRALFTDEEEGIAVKLNQVLESAISTSSDPLKRGSLVRIAGSETNTSDNTYSLGDKIDAIDKYITTLKARLESEYNRYWRQFSSLEVAIQRLNTQSSWLADF